MFLVVLHELSPRKLMDVALHIGIQLAEIHRQTRVHSTLLAINHRVPPVLVELLHVIILMVLLLQIHLAHDLHLIRSGFRLNSAGEACSLNAID